MVDSIQHGWDVVSEPVNLDMHFEAHHSNLIGADYCESCKKLLESQKRPFRFAGYSKVNPLKEDTLTDHQFFLCDNHVHAFLFKYREWCK